MVVMLGERENSGRGRKNHGLPYLLGFEIERRKGR
jgi:hypothetical protein